MEKKVRVIGKIFETNEYKMFKFRKDNRPVGQSNVAEKMESIKKVGQVNPIIVDTSFFVVDGQHRLTACMKLGLPVKYTVDETFRSTADVAHIQGQHQKWNIKDEVHSFSQSNENYKVYEEFKKAYPEFAHTILLIVLSGSTNRDKHIESDWHNGTFVVKEKVKAQKTLENLRALGRFYKGYNKRGFVLAILRVQSVKDFDMSRMLRKMPKRCKEIMDFSRTEDYIEVLEDMYNWKEQKKVSFRN